jgi:hypothetical protein
MKPRERLTFKVELRDEHGRVIGETDAITLKGLLSLAHDDGLRLVRTQLMQVPTKKNGQVAIVRARVHTSKGSFTGVGDASPDNVEPRFAVHLPRLAESRALARALRFAVNIGEVALEELGSGATIRGAPKSAEPPSTHLTASSGAKVNEPHPSSSPHPAQDAPRQGDRERRAMSDAQRKLLFRLAFDLGATKENVREHVLGALGVARLEWAERDVASAAIDKLQAERGKRRDGMNGGAHDGA